MFYLPFTLCFIVPNLIKFAPWIWDNIKILFYWWIASAPLVALLLARLWEGPIFNRVMAGSLFVMLTLAGGLDVLALVTRQGEYQEFDRDGVTFAEMIKQKTIAARDDPARANSQHADFFDWPAFGDGLSRPHLDTRHRLRPARSGNQEDLCRAHLTRRPCWQNTASIML